MHDADECMQHVARGMRGPRDVRPERRAQLLLRQNPLDQRLLRIRQIDRAKLRIGRAVEARGDIGVGEREWPLAERGGGGKARETLAGAARQTFAADAEIVFERQNLRLQAACARRALRSPRAPHRARARRRAARRAPSHCPSLPRSH